MPIHFILRLPSGSTTTELSGLCSSTLFTLGRTISLDASLEGALDRAPDNAPLSTPEASKALEGGTLDCLRGGRDEAGLLLDAALPAALVTGELAMDADCAARLAASCCLMMLSTCSGVISFAIAVTEKHENIIVNINIENHIFLG